MASFMNDFAMQKARLERAELKKKGILAEGYSVPISKSNIVQERINDIKYEIEEILGSMPRVDYDYNDEGYISGDIKSVFEYVEWELENKSYSWQERSERDKKDVVRLLSEYIKLQE